MWWWFIPAGAGNTPAYADITSSSSVYPRWRGEHIYRSCSVRNGIGLSPLARGTPELGSARHADIRFIPAGAGNTFQYARGQTPTAVYPRWRGEHASRLSTELNRHGLSPLARGTQWLKYQHSDAPRFIPAGAGNTLPHCYCSLGLPVYPRWRGEHRCGSCFRVNSRGLSPLARGTHVKLAWFEGDERFIPAGAGNTGTLILREIDIAVYPRWRGEHRCWTRHWCVPVGLSPLARGTRLLAHAYYSL